MDDRRQRRTTLALLLAVVGALALGAGLWLAGRPDGRLHVSVLGAGDGVAVLVRTPDGTTLLVDTGADPTALATSLGRALPTGLHDLGLLVLTGGGRGEVGGITALEGRVAVGALAVPVGLDTPGVRRHVDLLAAAGTAVHTLPAGSVVAWHGCDLTLLPVPAPGEAAPAQPQAALRLRCAGGTAVILGAAGPAQLEELAAVGRGRLGAGLLVAPPDQSVPAALLDAVRPLTVAVPGVRAPRGAAGRTLRGAVRLRTVAADGTLDFAGDPDRPLGSA